ncbi:hypothetical protein OH799_06080 [Nocardia sp. NBC_00881]|uniref:hypothetical protein n=1 Tax=Nocardia sp. NBC_00881 TaxID=2975995 RepID=UPI0038671E02|nr:hypothetical protein OH799_06080 [Nocardia sp. NBC_00881]
MPAPAERTLSPGKPVTERWQIFGLLVPLVVLRLVAVPVSVDRVAGGLTASGSAIDGT